MITKFNLFVEELGNPALNKEISTLQQQLNLTLQQRDEVENKDTIGDVNKRSEELKKQIQDITNQKNQIEQKIKDLENQQRILLPDDPQQRQIFLQQKKLEIDTYRKTVDNFKQTIDLLNKKIADLTNVVAK